MEKTESSSKGKVIMATVKGDVHDIGKNLVGIIIGNNGYDVLDLGINTPAEKIREAVINEKADFLGLSGLLVKSASEMVNTVAVLREAGIDIPIFVGGAALTEKFTINKIEPSYKNNIVIYSKDAMTALSDLNKMIVPEKFEEFKEYLQKRRDLLLINCIMKLWILLIMVMIILILKQFINFSLAESLKMEKLKFFQMIYQQF